MPKIEIENLREFEEVGCFSAGRKWVLWSENLARREIVGAYEHFSATCGEEKQRTKSPTDRNHALCIIQNRARSIADMPIDLCFLLMLDSLCTSFDSYVPSSWTY